MLWRQTAGDPGRETAMRNQQTLEEDDSFPWERPGYAQLQQALVAFPPADAADPPPASWVHPIGLGLGLEQGHLIPCRRRWNAAAQWRCAGSGRERTAGSTKTMKPSRMARGQRQRPAARARDAGGVITLGQRRQETAGSVGFIVSPSFMACRGTNSGELPGLLLSSPRRRVSAAGADPAC